MSDKWVIDCLTGKAAELSFTPEELSQRAIEQQLESLKPSVEEVEKAERQINLINDMVEMGVI